jgi:hypothetical protein
VHSLKWHDHDGIEHLHVVRSDDLDDVLRQVRTVKAFISASKARARDENSVEHGHMTTQAPDAEPEPEQADSAYSEPTDPTRMWCSKKEQNHPVRVAVTFRSPPRQSGRDGFWHEIGHPSI